MGVIPQRVVPSHAAANNPSEQYAAKLQLRDVQEYLMVEIAPKRFISAAAALRLGAISEEEAEELLAIARKEP